METIKGQTIEHPSPNNSQINNLTDFSEFAQETKNANMKLQVIVRQNQRRIY